MAANAPSLERCIRKELEEQGFLILNYTEVNDTADDKILTELLRCQTELKVSCSVYEIVIIYEYCPFIESFMSITVLFMMNIIFYSPEIGALWLFRLSFSS